MDEKQVSEKKIGKWGITWIILWAITLLCLIFLLPFGIFLLIIFAIAFPISFSSKKEKGRKQKWGIPLNAPKIDYYSGYDAPLFNKLYYVCDDAEKPLQLCEALPNDKKEPRKIMIDKKDIVLFSKLGDIRTWETTKGGGVSVGGAVIGGALMGPAGAILGGRKKTKTETHTQDDRKTVLTFMENGREKTIFLGYAIYGKLCWYCHEKKDAFTQRATEATKPQSATDIPEEIKKLADLHEQGILTDEEFSTKKAELLARI